MWIQEQSRTCWILVCLPLEPLPSPIMVSALDRGILTTITHKTTPITLIFSGNHSVGLHECHLIGLMAKLQ